MNQVHDVVVAGSTFGARYVAAAQTLPDVRLTGLLARGGSRSQDLARRCGVRLWTSPEQVPDETDLVCIAVRSGGVGGAGTDLATALLERGIPVLHELPVGQVDARALVRAARRGGTVVAVADHYRWLPAVRAFRAAGRALLQEHPPVAVGGHLSVQPAYTLACLLTDLGLAGRPVDLQVAHGSVVSGTLGEVPVCLQYATVLDDTDTDNDVRLPSLSLHARTGTLTLCDVHGPVLWTPTLHLPPGLRKDPSLSAASLMTEDTTTVLYDSGPLTSGQALDQLWPRAIATQMVQAMRAARGGPMSGSAAQRLLGIASLWDAITAGVAFPDSAPTSGVDERRRLTDRLHEAARGAASPTPEEEDVCP
ncbi:Gfo/Idh/MocA family oxidoreductase [Arsenicicoccus dermatophilus]|uniref:Gfo/Idh/MocA family oxidoreductase n=1 Tax=Arsenicicoccus dermatophilus TaxID=1076331 RepID=UPI001F4D16B0|nr:Gfo/Idh/MocA family oxidoreductase [Arsenicicoccus dermatophilus]